MSDPTISLVRWDEMQHYRDRDPPWIKLYRDTLTSEGWMLGDDHTKLVMCALMLIAARYKNAIPAKTEVIKAMAHLKMSEKDVAESLAKLVELKFIEIHGLNGSSGLISSAVLANRYTEKEKSSELNTSKGNTELPVELEIRPVEAIFRHWQMVWNKPRAKLDPKRHAAITRQLKSYDQATLCEAISGYRNSQHHMGQNDRHTVYDDISLFLRDAAHVDAGLQFANGSVPKRRAKTVEELEAEEAAKHAKH
jgi:hypothetical protein